MRDEVIRNLNELIGSKDPIWHGHSDKELISLLRSQSFSKGYAVAKERAEEKILNTFKMGNIWYS